MTMQLNIAAQWKCTWSKISIKLLRDCVYFSSLFSVEDMRKRVALNSPQRSKLFFLHSCDSSPLIYTLFKILFKTITIERPSQRANQKQKLWKNNNTKKWNKWNIMVDRAAVGTAYQLYAHESQIQWNGAAEFRLSQLNNLHDQHTHLMILAHFFDQLCSAKATFDVTTSTVQQWTNKEIRVL